VRDERGAECGEKDAGGAMVDPLAADPHPPSGEVEPDEPLSVAEWGLHLRDSDVDLIGIRGRKFTRILVLAGLLAGLCAFSGCGDDDDVASTTPTATTPAGTATTESTPRTETEREAEEPAETETEPAEGPEDVPGGEDMPGGAGDEEPARTLALFTARGGRITPRVVRVPAFIAVKVELRSADGQTYALRFGDTTITAGGELSSVGKTIDGLRPGEAIMGKPAGPGNPVRIEATAEPGP
jgi:hypothetical protein